MSLSKALWEENAGFARASLEHRFVRGLGDGSLPLGSFRAYVAQDAFFLESFARAYALALAHSPDGEGMREFAGLAKKLERLIDRYASDEPAVHDAYRRAMELELAFFEANAGAD
ncbi:hypothetical protein GBA65_02440 [Rubrobacter marinus]|uniref:Thiaminase-2/PQQC domain-containing protein n=1 Tax=Rubrobacter marinus TaxID=2653852 RepID=A0A6G8PTA0_9ACTN|nr:hypothetical protein [Rubrobacter marinus]QIN77553.1 hypothetical protein GBA65_02440 [Rubrobacter marinus]